MNQGTKLDSFAIELPFQEGLTYESHPIWVNGFSIRSDNDNFKTGSRGRINYNPKDGFCKIHFMNFAPH